MNRRHLLAAAVAAIPAATVASLGAALAAGDVNAAVDAALFGDAPESPIMQLYREWDALYRYLNTEEAAALPQDQFSRECDRRVEMEDRVVTMPVRGAADFAAKLLILTNHCDHELPGPEYLPEFWAEARALVEA